jgi:hypothetical protein
MKVLQKLPSNHCLLFLDFYEEIKNFTRENVWPDGHHVDEEVLCATEVLRSKLWRIAHGRRQLMPGAWQR